MLGTARGACVTKPGGVILVRILFMPILSWIVRAEFRFCRAAFVRSFVRPFVRRLQPAASSRPIFVRFQGAAFVLISPIWYLQDVAAASVRQFPFV